MPMRLESHTVERGDTLWSLAERHYQDGQRWRDIFLTNAPMMTANAKVPEKVGPNFIFPGQTLVIVTDVEFEPSGN